MNNSLARLQILDGTFLKLAALVCMTVDHIGLFLFPDQIWMRVIGRLAFPIFAYMIAEGCRYTRNILRYFLMVFGLGVLCQLVSVIWAGSWSMCTLITFALSILLILSVKNLQKKKTPLSIAMALVSLLVIFFLCFLLPKLLPSGNYEIEYGLFGVLLPAAFYLPRHPLARLGLGGLCMVFLALDVSQYLHGVQWYGLLALIPLFFYSGKRGKWKLKYLFYIYYPSHLGILYLIHCFS